MMAQQVCSEDRSVLTLSDLGIDSTEFLKLSNTSHKLDPDTILSIFGLDGAAVSEIYQQAGIVPPYVDHKSIEGLYYAMMWLYLSGRAAYGLDGHCKIQYTEGLKDRETIPAVNEDLMETRAVVDRMRAVLGLPYNLSWLIRFAADQLINGGWADRRAVLMGIAIGGKDSLIRPDYKPLEPYIDIKSIKHKKKRICFSKSQIYCFLDRIRIDACHHYKGSRESYVNAMFKSTTAISRPLYGGYEVMLPNLNTSSKAIVAMLKGIKLGL